MPKREERLDNGALRIGTWLALVVNLRQCQSRVYSSTRCNILTFQEALVHLGRQRGHISCCGWRCRKTHHDYRTVAD